MSVRRRTVDGVNQAWLDPLPIRRIEADPEVIPDQHWLLHLAPVRQLLSDGLDLPKTTVLVGENGTGKSTILEAVAMAYGLNGEGGSIHATHTTWSSESPLHSWLRLIRGAGAPKWGYFVRAETTHGLFTFLDSTRAGSGSLDPDFHPLSHGQSFGALLDTKRFSGGGFYVLDEPEAGLSFTAQLRLLGQFMEMTDRPNTQLLVATHSPILAALPDAHLIELTDDGMHESAWEDLESVHHYRNFCDGPERYLRHLR